MTTTREQLIQGVREVLITALALTDAQVVPADDEGPRPALPYLTVQVVGAGEILSRESVLSTSGANATNKQRAIRRTRATVRGYGRAASEWVELLGLRLSTDAVYTESVTRGISLETDGAALSATTTRDTGREEVTVQEMICLYQVTDETAASSGELGEVQVALTLDRYSGDPSPLTDDVSVDM